MDFYEVLDQVVELLRSRKRITYRMLGRQFDLDDTALGDLKEELLFAYSQIKDEEGRGLIWAGETEDAPSSVSPRTPEAASAPNSTQEHEPLAYTPQYLTEKILTSRSALEGERKQVTVLFADIKDSTELIRDLDPEEAQHLLDPAIHIMMEAVHRFEGTVNQVLGDGIMSIFGAPIAHEDHAARACYAALAMQTAMDGYTEQVLRAHGIPLQIRVGLNSGEVVVRTIGNDLHMDYSAVGQTTNLASRMEQLAAPGSIRLSTATLRMVEGLVQVNDLGLIPVKGMSAPVAVYELTGASRMRRRLQASVARGLTKFVGREMEISVLHQTLAQSGAGQGQLVAAVGEPGVGKSRLVYEFVHSHRTQGWLVLESTSVSYGKATPYFPVIELLKRYVRVEDGHDARTIRANITGHILTLDETLQDTIPALCFLLDVLPEDSPFLQLDPPQRRQRTLDGLKRILLRESQVQPLLLVFEDLHWIDSETQALLDSLVESLPTAQLLLLVNYRPEYQHGWGSKACYTQLRLDPLAPESADALLEALLGEDASLEQLKQLLIERTAGNPFFLEESVRTLVETHVLTGELGAYCLVQEQPTIQVPPTVQAVLAARIDRLPQDEKRLLQTAAVIGMEVPFTLLQAVTEVAEETLRHCLTHLQTAEFLYETSLFPECIYTFKHALTHEVAYSSLLQERRRLLHAQILAALEMLASGREDEQVDRLAQHAVRGQVWDKALMYCRQAGARAFTASAHRAAVGYLEQALEALAYLPPNHTTLEQAIDVRCDLYHALVPFAQQERALTYLRDAETLAEDLVDQRRLERVYRRMIVPLVVMQDYEAALAYCQRAYAMATALGDVALQADVNVRTGPIYHDLGDYRRAMAYLQQASSVFQGERRYQFLGTVVTLPSVNARVWMGQCCVELGAFADGIAYIDEARQIAEEVNRPYDRLHVYFRLGQLQVRQSALHQAIPLLERVVALGQEADILTFYPGAAAYLALAYALAGRVTDAIPLLEQIEGNFVVRGEAYLFAGEMEEADRLVQRGLANARERNMRGEEARALWLLGEIAMRRDPPDMVQAEAQYHQALALADELGMRPLQAHCHRDLGTLFGLTGCSEQSSTELSTAIEMYQEMEMTFWLLQAKTALTQVE
jgi:class 3 adenylate cyclase/tetratricopeptide (TPR) repeat protein